MLLSGFHSPNTPDGDFYDVDLNIFIVMEGGHGVGVRMEDESVSPFPYEFGVLDGEPKNPGVKRKAAKIDPPSTIWGIPVVEAGAISPDQKLPDGEPLLKVVGVDPAIPDSDHTTLTFQSDGIGSIKIEPMDDILGGILGGTQTDADEWVNVVPKGDIQPPQQIGAARDFLARMFEPDPDDARIRFRPGDIVKTIRPDLFGWIPLGCSGVIEKLEHPESVMSTKGRPYYVRFDLIPFKIPLAPEMLAMMKRLTDPPHPEFHESMLTNMGVNDLELVAKGANWNPDYKHEFEVDRLAETMANMTPEDWDKALTEITGAIMQDRAETPPERPPFGNLNPEQINKLSREFFQNDARPRPKGLRPVGESPQNETDPNEPPADWEGWAT